jgi:UMF1 family MFS transporter
MRVGFHTISSTSILYASSILGMSPAKIIAIGVLVQLSAIGSAMIAPRLQRKLGLSNLRFLLGVVLLAQLMPLYACAGLILPFGGLRTEGEMYVVAVYFGLVSLFFDSRSSRVNTRRCTVPSTVIHGQFLQSLFHL